MTIWHRLLIWSILCLGTQETEAKISRSIHPLIKRAVGQQASLGQCMNCQGGGRSNDRYYTCCNNCDGLDDTCQGIEYSSVKIANINRDFCDVCGTDGSRGDALICDTVSTYDCAGCNGQTEVRSACDSVWLNTPDNCWAWQQCFTLLCKQAPRNPAFNSGTGKRSIDEGKLMSQRAILDNDLLIPPSFCGDATCNGLETFDSCPLDCCSVKNPIQCSWTDFTSCLPKCCSESTCCETEIIRDPHFLQPDSDLDIPLCYNLITKEKVSQILLVDSVNRLDLRVEYDTLGRRGQGIWVGSVLVKNTDNDSVRVTTSSILVKVNGRRRGNFAWPTNEAGIREKYGEWNVNIYPTHMEVKTGDFIIKVRYNSTRDRGLNLGIINRVQTGSNPAGFLSIVNREITGVINVSRDPITGTTSGDLTVRDGRRIAVKQTFRAHTLCWELTGDVQEQLLTVSERNQLTPFCLGCDF
ncbi:unnamed protein product [Owenia fusiformis]|uniref:Uncharacterized protein n=1 Tax=Owenia fusiformis TaxID=6347 RepID=A0A8J1U0F6_OWEFU|nr:unnamed protein product [Owenia fusiformis]